MNKMATILHEDYLFDQNFTDFSQGSICQKMLLFQAMIWHPAGEKAITLTDGELNDRCHMASLGLT